MVTKSDGVNHGLASMTRTSDTASQLTQQLDTTRIKCLYLDRRKVRSRRAWHRSGSLLHQHGGPDARACIRRRCGSTSGSGWSSRADDRQHARSTRATSSSGCELIKRLVDDGGINLAGVQRLLSIAEVVQRMRPLMRDEALSARDARRRLVAGARRAERACSGFD